LRQGVVLRREQTPVERAGQFGDPAVMERVEDARFDARPVVDRHGVALPCKEVTGDRSHSTPFASRARSSSPATRCRTCPAVVSSMADLECPVNRIPLRHLSCEAVAASGNAGGSDAVKHKLY